MRLRCQQLDRAWQPHDTFFGILTFGFTGFVATLWAHTSERPHTPVTRNEHEQRPTTSHQARKLEGGTEGRTVRHTAREAAAEAAVQSTTTGSTYYKIRPRSTSS